MKRNLTDADASAIVAWVFIGVMLLLLALIVATT